MVLVIQKTSLQDWKKMVGKGFQNPIPDVNFLCGCSNHSTILALGSHKLETHQKNLMIPSDLDWKVGSLNPKLLLLTLTLLNSDPPQRSQTERLATPPKPKMTQKTDSWQTEECNKNHCTKDGRKRSITLSTPACKPKQTSWIQYESHPVYVHPSCCSSAAEQQQQHIVNSLIFPPSPLLSYCIKSEQVQFFLVKFTATQRAKSWTRYNTAAAALLGVPVPQQQLPGKQKEGKEGVELGSRQERHQNTKPFCRLHSS